MAPIVPTPLAVE